MIHATRPFIVNEWIQTKIEGYEVSGTVEVCISNLLRTKFYKYKYRGGPVNMFFLLTSTIMWQ